MTDEPQNTQAAATETGGAAPAAPIILDGGLCLYPVLSPLRHDGEQYSPDDPEADVIALPPKEARALQAIGVLGEATGDADVEARQPKQPKQPKKAKK